MDQNSFRFLLPFVDELTSLRNCAIIRWFQTSQRFQIADLGSEWSAKMDFSRFMLYRPPACNKDDLELVVHHLTYATHMCLDHLSRRIIGCSLVNGA